MINQSDYNQSNFDATTAQEVVDYLNANIRAPFVKAYASSLGGPKYISILISISVDPKATWVGGIFENSRYIKMHYTNGGVITLVSSTIGKKFRKTTVKSKEDAVSRINMFLPR